MLRLKDYTRIGLNYLKKKKNQDSKIKLSRYNPISCRRKYELSSSQKLRNHKTKLNTSSSAIVHPCSMFFWYCGYLMACFEIHRLKGLQHKAVCRKVCCMHFPPQLWIPTLGSKPVLNSSQRSQKGKLFAPASCCPPIQRQQSSSQPGVLKATWSIRDSGCGRDAALPGCYGNHGWKMGEANATHRQVLEGQIWDGLR